MQCHPIHLIGNTGQAIQITIHTPSQYICTNISRILPDWKQQNIFWVVIVLQRSQYELVEITRETEAEKQRLRERFMRYAFDVAFDLRDRVFLTDFIDPRTGYPLLSRPGEIPHDDTAAVKALLDYPLIQNQCRVLIHPDWGTAVYPSVLISTAPPMILEKALKNTANQHHWYES